MKTAGIGIGASAGFDSKSRIFSVIRRRYPDMILADDASLDADVLIINADRQIPALLAHRMPSESSYVIMIVHELHREVFPYLKLADHIIFTSELQRSICEKLVGLEYTCSVLALPHSETVYSETKKERVCLTFMNGIWRFQDVIHEMPRWEAQNQIDRYVYVTYGKSGSGETAQELIEQFAETRRDVTILDSSELSDEQFINLINEACAAYFLRDEPSAADVEQCIADRRSGAVYETISHPALLSELAYAPLMLAPRDGVSFYNLNSGKSTSAADWIEKISHLIETERPAVLENRRKLRDSIEIDTFEDLNVIYGGKLTNQFIFSICFRNQAEKIIRCLDSVINQTGGHDVGIAVADDCSTDGSSELVVEHLRRHGIDSCVVKNLDRKYASRNFYNICNEVADNDESVIIELDGDDYLASENVLTILDSHYSRGALKTCGSFNTFPETSTLFDEESRKGVHNIDFSDPWNLSRCNAWLVLRSCSRKIIRQVEVDYYLHRQKKTWLPSRHDSAVQPRFIELAGDACVFIPELLYTYDLSGNAHDHSDQETPPDIEVIKDINSIYHPFNF